MTRGVNWFKGLLPSGSAFKLSNNSAIRKLFGGIAAAPDSLEKETAEIYGDVFPDTTRTLEEWEKQFAIMRQSSNDSDRRSSVTSAWRQNGGQSPGYLQDVLRDAGFNVYVHEASEELTDQSLQLGMLGNKCSVTACEDSVGYIGGQMLGDEFQFFRKIRDPREYVGGYSDFLGPDSGSGTPLYLGGPQLGQKKGSLMANELLEEAPAALDDPNTWPFVWYLADENFGDFATVSNERRNEFITKIQQIRPRHTWIVLLINFGV